MASNREVLIMHATRVLQKVLRPVAVQLDQRNFRTLTLAVQALCSGRRLTLMELARHWPGAERVRAPLKQLDRWLSNPRVYTPRRQCYAAAIAWLIHCSQPVLVVDWSELKSDGRWHLLRAGVVVRGRTLTVEVHPEACKNSPRVEAAFLQQLQSLLPRSVCPIVVTDAGFRTPWFRAVEAQGWHWIGRVRHRTHVRLTGGGFDRWISGKSLHPQANRRARLLGWAQITESNSLNCRLVLVRRQRHGRVQRTRQGTPARGGHSCKMIRRAREPWLLATSCSLDGLSAEKIVRLYARRMQIEQSFRDLKSHRFGCAFEDTLTRLPKRLEMLLLIFALASLLAWLTGLAATATRYPHIDIGFYSRHHSMVWLGWEILRHCPGGLPAAVPRAAQSLRLLLAQPI